MTNTPMISAENAWEAADLIARRAGLTERIDEITGAKRVRLVPEIGGTDSDGNELAVWSYHQTTLEMTEPIRELLTAGLKEQVAQIDAQLAELGVAPPTGPMPEQ